VLKVPICVEVAVNVFVFVTVSVATAGIVTVVTVIEVSRNAAEPVSRVHGAASNDSGPVTLPPKPI
jgi:hypothetical protein